LEVDDFSMHFALRYNVTMVSSFHNGTHGEQHKIWHNN